MASGACISTTVGYRLLVTTREQLSACAELHALHESGCFVIPNPWDVGTAVALSQMGFKALATTSAGLAFTHGLSDSTPVSALLPHLRSVVAATRLPVVTERAC